VDSRWCRGDVAHRAGGRPVVLDETVGFFAAFADLLGHFRSRGEQVGRCCATAHGVSVVCPLIRPHRRGPGNQRALSRRRLRAAWPSSSSGGVEEAFWPGSRRNRARSRARSRAAGGSEEREQTPRVHWIAWRNLRQSAGVAAGASRGSVEAVRKFAAPRPVFTVPGFRSAKPTRFAACDVPGFVCREE